MHMYSLEMFQGQVVKDSDIRFDWHNSYIYKARSTLPRYIPIYT